MKSAILKSGVLALVAILALPAVPAPARASAKKDAAIAGGLAGAMLLGAAIANSKKRKKSNTTIIYQQAPPPPVVVAPPPPVAQPQMLPPNCQHVLQTIRVEGIPQPQQAMSVACRQPDGSWVYQ